ncbi:hypothetical protein [Halopelagius longus]|uniref:hypothetical protein n=1 Tax=Halopelagius longus TaxID=1236180 RepID=UPI001113A442|nr:hypothetical protein [Halopelagius longus]
MVDIVESFVAAIVLLVGLMLMAVFAGVDPSVATGLFEGAVRVVVAVFFVGAIGLAIFSAIGGR